MRTFTSLAIFATSAQAVAYTTWTGGPTFDLSYDTTKESIMINATVPANQWLGIAWGKGMNNVDMVLFQGKGGVGEISDLWATGE